MRRTRPRVTSPSGTPSDHRRPERDRNLYLKRIGYQGSADPSLETLRHLHRQHLRQVPFENLDIHAGRSIRLDHDALFDKIVRHRRGGFCYELNGLFGWLLENLGFQVSRLSARPPGPDGQPGPAFDHLALLVELDRPWLVDVGFGDSFLEPVELGSPHPHRDRTGDYRVRRSGDLGWALERRASTDPWAVQYRFDLDPQPLAAFGPRCHFHATSPRSHFAQQPVCSRVTANGRLTLTPSCLVESTAAGRCETAVQGWKEWRALLETRFRFFPAEADLATPPRSRPAGPSPATP